ncbi:MAG: tyrosine recombinase XerC [Leptothrix ochracea]|uniref:tyrosine recombinase XerC n=1 Tax=Leptothrix ochracea TaxID=735331 RepID=UPI0034E216B0
MPPSRPPLHASPLAQVRDLPADMAAFLTHLRVERRLAERTLSMYHDALVRLMRAAAELPLDLRQVQPSHVRRWAARLNSQGLSARSIAIHLAAWRGLYRYLGRAGLVGLNPVEGIRPPKAGRPLPKALSVEQAVALAEHQAGAPAADEPLELRDRAIVELLYGCGLRISELLGLDVRPGGATAGWVDVAEAEAQVFGKGQRRRSLPVGPVAVHALKAWLAVRATLAKPEEGALFVSTRGTRLTDGQLRRRLAQRALDAGLGVHVQPHMLRHSYASHLLQSSGDLRAVQELLGHAQVTTTQAYTRLDFQHLARVYDAAHPRARKG